MTIRRLLHAAVAVILCIGLYGAWSQASAAADGDSGKLVTHKGVIKSVDTKKGVVSFVRDSDKKPVTVSVPDKKLLKGMKRGGNIRVSYRPGKPNVAERVSKVKDVLMPVGCGAQ